MALFIYVQDVRYAREGSSRERAILNEMTIKQINVYFSSDIWIILQLYQGIGWPWQKPLSARFHLIRSQKFFLFLG